MRKYFKGVTEKDADGWMLSFVSGHSNDDGQDYVVDTNSLHADQVPGACNDAKSFSQLVAGLLNCFYNRIETKELSEEMIIKMGIVDKVEEAIPSPKNPQLPF